MQPPLLIVAAEAESPVSEELMDTSRRAATSMPLSKITQQVDQERLKLALAQKLHETQKQIRKLEHAFETFGERPSAHKCDAIEGLVKETNGIIAEMKGRVAKEAALAAACQPVEHYEIARYGTLREWAKILGNEQAHTILSEILDQEKAANSKLNAIANEHLNYGI